MNQQQKFMPVFSHTSTLGVLERRIHFQIPSSGSPHESKRIHVGVAVWVLDMRQKVTPMDTSLKEQSQQTVLQSRRALPFPLQSVPAGQPLHAWSRGLLCWAELDSSCTP
ncbi:hypothetical protein Mapa_013502 [Marchantia paleacea]|nr:hypothetical protein Mapa_013502 [Marchantia paleacea]